MNLFDFFHNSLFQQELKQSRRQISQQRAYDELEAAVYIDFAEELDDQQQNGIGKSDYDRNSQNEYDFMDEYDCADIY